MVDNAGDMAMENAGEGNDTVFSTANFALSANVENLVLQGGADLQGFGNDLANAILSNVGNNLIDGGAGADAMNGGAGNDTYFVDNAGDKVIESAGQGNDTVLSSVSFMLSANVETLVLQGGADLQGFGNGLANSLFGNTGNNLLDGGAGADAMAGGAGNDTYFVDNAGDAVIENAGQGSDAVFASVNYGLTANVETLVLQGGADLQGFGNGLANSLFGNSGNNLLDGGAGADAMSGGAGNDTYFVDNAGDAVLENPGEGNDAVFASINYGLTANVETLVLQGAADLQGFGNNLANTLFGNSGNNLLDGGTGADAMLGGAGNDTYFVDNAADAVIENAGQGSDAVFASVNYGLTANVETLVMQGGADLQGFGNTLANSIFGNSGNNLINGGAGADTMVGGLGNDTYFVDDGLDQVIENVGAGNDAIFTTAHFVLSANVETLVQQGSADLRRNRQRARQLDLRQFRQQHAGRPGRRRHSHRQCRQRHLRVQRRAGQRRHRRGLRRQWRGGGRFAPLRRLRRGRQLHQHRRDALAGQLQWRRLARRHHVQQRRGDRRQRLPVRVRTTPHARLFRGRSDGDR